MATPPPSAAPLSAPAAPMTRLRAERAIEAAYRTPRAGGGASGGSAVTAGTSTLTRRRSLNRLLSRGSSSLLPVASELYLQQSGVQLFVEDLARQLGDCRPEQPALFIASYLDAVARGTHVRGREFEFVHGCLQNRAAFLAQLQRSYAKVDQAMQLTAADFAELVACQCRDLPPEMLRHARCHLPVSDDGHVRAPLREFLSAFSACFFYYEFLGRAAEIYSDVHAAKEARVSSPRANPRPESIANAMAADRVVAKLRVVVQQNGFPVPPMTDVELLVLKTSGGFHEFCDLFYQSAAVADSIAELQLAFQHLATAS